MSDKKIALNQEVELSDITSSLDEKSDSIIGSIKINLENIKFFNDKLSDEGYYVFSKYKKYFEKHFEKIPKNINKYYDDFKEYFSDSSDESDSNLNNSDIDKNKIKKKFGQFYTTNYDYILQNMYIPVDVKNIIEPFAGKGDLLKFINIKNYNVECYDIDPKQDYIIKRDTLNNPPIYKNKFILTNPPYLARNKCNDKFIFDKYKTNDLYKCFLKEIINHPSDGGIIIVPLNFFCSIRKGDINLRMKFLNIYSINHINIFEEKVFKDTTYTVCCFQFEIKKSLNDEIDAYIYPSKNKIKLLLNDENNYTIGGEIYNLQENKNIIIERLTKNNNEKKYISNILLKCIDDSSTNKICLTIVSDEDIYIDNTEKLSARSYASFLINPKLSTTQQEEVVILFNKYIEEKRKKYNSLFLTNYRESNTISRKRISFGLAVKIINYCVMNILNQS